MTLGRLTREELAQLVPALRANGRNRAMSDFSEDDDNIDETRYLDENKRLCTSERRVSTTRTRKER